MSKGSDVIDDAKIAGAFTKSAGSVIVTIILGAVCICLGVLLVLEKRSSVNLVKVGTDRYTGSDFNKHMRDQFGPLEYRLNTHLRLHEEWDRADSRWKLDTTKKLERIEREIRKHRSDD